MTPTHDVPIPDWRSLNDRLVATLKPFAAPVAISFHAPDETPPAPHIEPRYPPPNERGRTGQVAGGLCLLDSRSG